MQGTSFHLFVSVMIFPQDPASWTGDLLVPTKESTDFAAQGSSHHLLEGNEKQQDSLTPQIKTTIGFHLFARMNKNTPYIVPKQPLLSYEGRLCLIGP